MTYTFIAQACSNATLDCSNTRSDARANELPAPIRLEISDG